MEILKKELNDEQLAIAKDLTGNTLVIAGLGSGKTRLLVHRVGYQLRVSPGLPFKVLCLTFTNEAAKELIGRFRDIVPPRIRSRIWGGTFHQFGQSLLSSYGHLLAINREFEVIDESQAAEILEFDLSDVHLNTPYSLKVIVLPSGFEGTERGGVGGIISGVHVLTIGKRIRVALEEKAGKYGHIEVPFIIAVYAEGQFPADVKHELDALLGDREWLVPQRGMGEVTERRKPNGFFNSVREGKRRHVKVSAVLFYRFKWLEHAHVHLVRIYHNPFTLRPLRPDLFPEVPQMVSDINFEWINGEPE